MENDQLIFLQDLLENEDIDSLQLETEPKLEPTTSEENMKSELHTNIMSLNLDPSIQSTISETESTFELKTETNTECNAEENQNSVYLEPKLEEITTDDLENQETEQKYEVSLPLRNGPNYRNLEDVWLLEHAKRFRQVYLAMSLGEDFLKEFVMYSYDVPVSRRFVPLVAITNANRYRKAIGIFDGVFNGALGPISVIKN